jgi:hypothetical protein
MHRGRNDIPVSRKRIRRPPLFIRRASADDSPFELTREESSPRNLAIVPFDMSLSTRATRSTMSSFIEI